MAGDPQGGVPPARPTVDRPREVRRQAQRGALPPRRRGVLVQDEAVPPPAGIDADPLAAALLAELRVQLVELLVVGRLADGRFLPRWRGAPDQEERDQQEQATAPAPARELPAVEATHSFTPRSCRARVRGPGPPSS